jgi:hypothetical protein
MNSRNPLSQESGALPQIIRTQARIYIVKSTACCRQCGNLAPVVTLAANADESELPDGEFGFFLLFHIERMPAILLQTLKRHSPSYGLCFDDELKMPCYRNVCAVCEYVFEEEDLTMDPGDAFNPIDESDYEPTTTSVMNSGSRWMTITGPLKGLRPPMVPSPISGIGT